MFTIRTMVDFVQSKLLRDQILDLYLHFVYTLKVNDLGFIETPYRKVEDGKVNLNDDPVYLSVNKKKI